MAPDSQIASQALHLKAALFVVHVLKLFNAPSALTTNRWVKYKSNLADKEFFLYFPTCDSSEEQ